MNCVSELLGITTKLMLTFKVVSFTEQVMSFLAYSISSFTTDNVKMQKTGNMDAEFIVGHVLHIHNDLTV
jgi:hypothetical protein